MYECCVGIKIIWCHWSTTTITTIADHSRRRQKLPPSVSHIKPCATRRHLRSMGDDPPSKQIFFLKGLRGCMALNTLQCYGDASSPEQRSTLRAIHPLNTPKIISDCSGGRCPSIWRVSTRRNASCGALGGHFRRGRPWLWWCFVACRSTNHFFWLNHGIVGIGRKLLSRARQFLRVPPRWRRRDKREKKIK
jgi:hypothetical protein